jgi:tol-pal system protein YbgF
MLLRLPFRAVLLCALVFAAAPALAQDPTEILLRLDRLEAENRRLNGDVEQMQFQIRRLEEQLKKFQADVDFRFSDLEGGAAKPPKKRTEAENPADAPPADIAETPPSDLPADVAAVDQPPADPPSAEPKPAAKGGTPKADYDNAVALLEGESFQDAEVAFRAFLKAYPKDKLTPDALFGLGDSLFARERYADAAEHYLNLTNQFPKSGRAPEALLKLGMSLNALGARVEACSTYAEVTKKYPKAAAEVREAVKRQRQRADCQA